MLGRQGIIKEHEAEKIIDGLKAILADIEAGQVEFSLENEDIHMNIETIPHPTHRGHGQAAAHRPQPERSGGGGLPDVCPQGDPGHHRPDPGPGEGAGQEGRGQSGHGHARLHPPPAGPAHHLRPRHDGLRQHVQAGRDKAGGLSGADGRSAPWGRGPWLPPPTR